MNGAVAFLCLLMGQIQWERGEKLLAVAAYFLGVAMGVGFLVEFPGG